MSAANHLYLVCLVELRHNVTAEQVAGTTGRHSPALDIER